MLLLSYDHQKKKIIIYKKKNICHLKLKNKKHIYEFFF